MSQRIRRVVAFTFLAMSLSFPFPVLAGSVERPVLSLTWLDATRAFPIPFAPLAEEVDAAFDGVGVDIAWETTPDAMRHLRVMLLPVQPTVWKFPANAMGVTMGDVDQRNTVYIFLPSVMRALGLNISMKRLPTPREKHRIARAIGRVVCHEVYHALLFHQPHADDGLMRNRLHAGALIHPVARFSDESAAALRHAIREP